MKVHVDLFVNLKKYAPSDDSSFEMEIEHGAKIKAVLEVLKIPVEEKVIILINGRNADESDPLKEEDTITLFSPLSGG
jgi:molybdopterin converting factor small subunit